uniref:Lipoxygenase domain-containing protein n=1 Tax=Ciona savignyi TaxID=51511 RepID=H2Y5X3_CIOSA
ELESRDVDDEWLCERVIVTYMGSDVIFPIYDWIENQAQFTTGEAMIPQNVKNHYVKSLRHKEIEQKRAMYAWTDRPTSSHIGWGLPRYMNANTYKELPSIFQRNEIRQKHLDNEDLKAHINTTLKVLSVDSFHRFYEREKLDVKLNDFLSDWDTDEGMGRQCLTGVSPLAIQRCTTIPSNCDVTGDDVIPFLEGKSLEEAIKIGKIYLSDYSEILKDVKRNKNTFKKQLHCPKAIGLFYVSNSGTFLPIAIQLVPGDRDYLFTPSSGDEDWMLAKMYFRCAQANVHEWGYHFLYTHNVIEPFGVALFRCLPSAHPIYKLLRPHLRTLSAINTDARNDLIPETSKANQSLSISGSDLCRKMFKTFRFDDIIIPKVLKKLGTDDRTLLPNFHYRDDAMALWKIMEDYVIDVLTHHYSSDEEVEGDYELQGWARDVAREGLGWQDGDSRGFPETITTIPQLMEICVTLMFTSSAQHAAVNFGQFETYKFMPNAPVGLRLPPHKNGEGSKQRILDSLPDALMTNFIIAIAYALSKFAPNEVFLADFSRKYFTEDVVIGFQDKYVGKLKELESKILSRNQRLEHEYKYLLPSRIPKSIAV